MDAAERVHQLVAPALKADDVELVDLEVKPGLVRVIVDRDGGIDLEAIADLTRRLSHLLDEDDPINGRYSLEVSSPGVERPLRTPDHFRKALGATVTVKTRPDVEGERRIQGPLEAADDEGVTVAGRRLRYQDIDRAQTVFEWGPAPKPGKTKKKKEVSTP